MGVIYLEGVGETAGLYLPNVLCIPDNMQTSCEFDTSFNLSSVMLCCGQVAESFVMLASISRFNDHSVLLEHVRSSSPRSATDFLGTFSGCDVRRSQRLEGMR